MTFLIGGNFTSYLLSFAILSFYFTNNFFDVLTTADLLNSDILLLLILSNDPPCSGFVPYISSNALIIAIATGSLALITPNFWSKVELLIKIDVLDDY
jgi:hypothetical protein